MRTYQYHIGGKAFTIRFDEKQGAVSGVQLEGETLSPAPADLPAYAAVIALALLEDEVEVVHDDEADVITLANHPSPWADPNDAMTEKGTLIIDSVFNGNFNEVL